MTAESTAEASESVHTAPVRAPGKVSDHMASIAERVRTVGRAAGLYRVGICTAEVFETERKVLVERKDQGLAGSMQFTYRNPARSTDPARTLPDAASIVVGALSYRQHDAEIPGAPSAAVAKYATADYYAALRSALEAIVDELTNAGYRAVISMDSNALVDRAAAFRAGIGWFGKNANLLIEGAGSWFVLGSVITNARLVDTSPAAVADGCSTCTRCIDLCPTAAIVAPGVIDARRCLGWLLQAKEPIPVEFREAVGYRLYGCDDCQIVCPPNKVADRREAPGDSGADPGPWVDAMSILHMSDDELRQSFGRWYFADRDVRIWRRNAIVVIGNWAHDHRERTETDVCAQVSEIRAVLETVVSDGDPLLAEHAEWALSRSGSPVQRPT